MKTLNFLVFIVILLTFSTGAVEAQLNPHKWYDEDYWVINVPCAGEDAFGTVVSQSVRHINNPVPVVQITWQGKFIGLETGTEYNFNGHDMFNTKHSSTNEPKTETHNLISHLKGKGGVSLTIHSFYHITYNAEGIISASVEFDRIECR